MLAEPMVADAARDEHLQRCAECAAFAARVLRLEHRLAGALSVPVPESLLGAVPDMPDLAEQPGGDVISLGDARRDRDPPARGRFGGPFAQYWGLAAGLLVAIVAVVLLRPSPTVVGDPGQLLAEAVFEHVGHELFAMRPASTAVPASRLDTVVPSGLASMDAGVGLVSYARSCEINGRVVPHLVVQGERGPVTVLLLPEEPLERPVQLHRDGLDVVVFPVGDNGSVALIGRGRESVDAVRSRAESGISWTT